MSDDKIEFDMREIAEAVCKGHLRRYSDANSLKEDGANRWGIVVQYSPKHKKIRFQFLLKEMESALVDLQVDAEAFILDPATTLATMHHGIREKMDEFHKSRSAIIMPSSLEKKLLAEAISETRH